LCALIKVKDSAKQNKENVDKKSTQSSKRGASKPSSVINIDDDDSGGADSDIQEVSSMSALKTKIGQNKQAASAIRLTPKTEPDIDVPTQTQEFLQKRAASRRRGTGQAKAASILFKVTVVLQKNAGQKQGTRVPLQSRGFQLEDVFCLVALGI
jgi:hypothetical protein